MNKKNRDVAVVIQNMVQFYNIKIIINELLKLGKTVDIYVPKYEDDLGFNEIYENTFNNLIKLDYNVMRDSLKDVHYKVLLECYELDHLINIDHDYRLRFKYSSGQTKPKRSYKPIFSIPFDGCFVYDFEERDCLAAFCKTYLVGNAKFKGFKKKNINSDKKRVLYLPSYEHMKEIEKIADHMEELSKKFDIIVKVHHGTNFLNSEKECYNKMKKVSKEFYDSDIDIIELLKSCDAVLSDDSGAIFDSIFAEVPVALYSRDINIDKINNRFNTNQYEAVKLGIIPYTSDINDLVNVLNKCFNEKIISKQKELKRKMFYLPDDLTKDFINIIEDYLNDNINYKYKTLHDMVIKDYKDAFDKQLELNKEIYDLRLNNESLSDKINRLNQENIELKNLNKSYNNKVNKIYIKFRNALSKMGGNNGKN